MASRLNPYLNFDGDARQALEFYAQVFGGSLTFSTFGEYGSPDAPEADKIMHGTLVAGDGLTLMAADLPPGTEHNPGDNVQVCVSGEDSAELHGYWDRLSDGGVVTVALEKQMWGDEYGACVDRFGIPWMFNISVQPA